MSARAVVWLVSLCLVVAMVWVFVRARRFPQSAGIAPPEQAVTTAEAPPPDAIGPFYVGISSLDVGENERAARLFDSLAKELPAEPSIWADLGLARLRLGDLPGAEEALGTAAKLSPGNGQITVLQAIVDDRQGQFQRAIDRLRSLRDPDAADLYQLAELLGRTGPDADPREQLDVFDRILKRRPNNLVAIFSRARLLARSENKPLLSDAVKALDSYRQGWGPAAVQQYDAAKTAADAGNFRSAATDLAFLQNLNLATPAYQAALAELGMTGGSIGEPIREFLTYRQPEAVAAAADESLKFVEAPETESGSDFCVALDFAAKTGPSVVTYSDGALHIRGLGEIPVPGPRAALTRNSICAADFNGDGLPDLALIDSSGLKLWMQSPEGKFTAFRPAEDARGAFEAPGHGVWALDYDADGDLDLLIARDGAAPRILRNNGDDSFTAVDALASFPEIREIAWADFDGDGDDDLGFLEVDGRVMISWNNRSGSFAAPEAVSELPAVALTCGDPMGTGDMDLIALGRDGAINDLKFDRAKHTWTSRELARWSDPPDLADAFARGRASISIADLDNNGAVDVVASAGNASAIWLNEGRGKFKRLDGAPAQYVASVADIDGDGSLDLVGLSGKGAAVAHARRTKGYHWQTIQARTRPIHGDGRINSFGIGGRIEIRAGQLAEAAPITSPRTHFGLGDQNQPGMARIIWPNGVAQVEFDLQPDQEVTAVQRLKGSCPWVFARHGDTFQFVKDFIWRSPLGMRINSQDTAGVDQTEDWILIPGGVLSAENGAYEIRITAELWETHFFDHVALRAVDHPASVDAFVDERFVPAKQPKLEVLSTTPPRPFAWEKDQDGRDISKALAAADGEYAADFPLGEYQGIAGDHWVEFQLPEDAPADRPLVLIGDGWIYPTDSSLNVAMSQGNHPAPSGLKLEEYDPQNGWQASSGDLGFPAGKNKTVVIPLPTKSLRAAHRRFRLRTNLEVYWDRLAWAVALPNAEMKFADVETLSAELRYRGFSRLSAPDRRRPDIPQYDRLAATGPRWHDLEGFYTRYGDVRELLRSTDDRYVIMNAGDEMVLRFASPPPPPAGWTRDFVLIGDGWVKDGDFNTVSSRTVLPLPSHAQRQYGGPAQSLEEDPVFQRHMDDWRRFQTRYVTPIAFERGLMGSVSAPQEGGSP